MGTSLERSAVAVVASPPPLLSLGLLGLDESNERIDSAQVEQWILMGKERVTTNHNETYDECLSACLDVTLFFLPLSCYRRGIKRRAQVQEKFRLPSHE